MGLEAGRVSVTNDLASRLHQAIILSSEQHATDRIVPPWAAPASYFFYVSTIFSIRLPQRKIGKRLRRIDYLVNNVILLGV